MTLNKTVFTRSEIESLSIGDEVPNCFGKLAPIVEITARRDDIHGKLFICFYQAFGPNSSISGSIKEGESTARV